MCEILMPSPEPRVLRAVTYERYSSDKQNEKSIDAQRHENLRVIEKQGLLHVGSYSDEHASGRRADRPGLLELMRDAENGAFDVVVAFALDRISRRLAHIAQRFEQLEELGVLVICQGRKVRMIDVAIEGYFAQHYIDNLREHTRRGLRQKVTEGLSAGGICYGYRVDTVRNDPLKPAGRGHRVIAPDEAAIVLRIFEEYARGASPRAIAHRLNDEHVPPPRGGRKRTSNRPGWSGSTINGNRKRGTGILNNELYAGRLVWGRLSYGFSTKTQTRRSKPAADAPKVTPVPELQIVPDELWRKVKNRQAALDQRRGGRNAPVTARRPVRALSGLLKCYECGGGMSIVSHGRLGCSTHKNKGASACRNAATARYDEIEDLVLGAIREDLLRHEQTEHYVDRLAEARAAEAAREVERRHTLEAAKTRYEAEVERLTDALGQHGFSKALSDRLRAAEGNLADVERKLERKMAPAVPPPPAQGERTLDAFFAELMEMAGDKERVVILNDELHRIVDMVVLIPPYCHHDIDAWAVQLFGNLPALLAEFLDGDEHEPEWREMMENSDELMREALESLEYEEPACAPELAGHVVSRSRDEAGPAGGTGQVVDSEGTPKLVAGARINRELLAIAC
ncbi:MAG: recombinase family protein [Pseudomonadota bacterium]